MAVAQPLVRFGPPARLLSRNIQQVFPKDAYQTMLTDNFTPDGIARTRRRPSSVPAKRRVTARGGSGG